MSVIWQKDGVELDPRLMQFLAGEDVILDRELFPYDLEASRAHVRGLERIGVLTSEESQALIRGLDELEVAFAAGEFVLEPPHEDGHSAIEAYLIERLGEAGKKVHTGRSRNDQVLVATRLFLKAALGDARERCVEVAEASLMRARAERDVPMPGYTHLQRAVPSSLGMWFGAWAEAFLDNASLLDATLAWIDANPMGTAAGYGVNLPLDRAGATRELGFGRLQINPIYTQNSRGKFEMAAISALGQAMLDVRRMAWDLSLFSTAEFGFVKMPARYTTGSSIMPNKKNPDVVELMRASYAPLAGARAELEGVLSLPSGYHRDLQYTKGPLLRACRHAQLVLGLVPDLLSTLSFDKDAMLAAIDPGMYATDRAVELTAEGVPFRQAYQEVAGSLGALGERTAKGSLEARTSPGGCGDLRLEALEGRLDALRG